MNAATRVTGNNSMVAVALCAGRRSANAFVEARSPLGFRGGLSNLSDYVGDDPTNATDPSGLDIFYALDPTAVLGRGHSAVIIGPIDHGLTYTQVEKDGEHSYLPGVSVEGQKTNLYALISVESNPDIPLKELAKKWVPGKGGAPVKIEVSYARSLEEILSLKDAARYKVFVKFNATKEQDEKAIDYIGEKWTKYPGYRLLWKNCSNLALDALIAAGLLKEKNVPIVPTPNARALFIGGLAEREGVTWYVRDGVNKLKQVDHPLREIENVKVQAILDKLKKLVGDEAEIIGSPEPEQLKNMPKPK